MSQDETKGAALGLWVPVSGTKTLVAARRDLELNETADTREITTADSGDWREFLAGAQEWDLSLGHMLLLDDQTGDMEASHQALKDAKRNKNIIEAQLRYPGSNDNAEQGDCLVTELTLTSGYDEMATVAVTLQGTGPLSEVTHS